MAKSHSNDRVGSAKLVKNFAALFFPILPIVLIAAFVPLIVNLQEIPIPENLINYGRGSPVDMDFFSYSKAVVFITLSAILALVLASFYLNKLSIKGQGTQASLIEEGRFPPRRVMFLSMGVYVLFTIASCVLSEYISVAMMGFVGRYEGMWVLLGYTLLWFSIITMVEDMRQIHWIMGAVVFSGVIVALIGVGQFFGYDLFKSEFGKLLIIPESLKKYRENLLFTFGEKTIYSTLFNTNNVGSLFSMLTIMGLSFTLLLKNKMAKLGFGMFTLLSGFTLLGSNSRGGYMGTAVGILFLVAMLLIYYKFKFKFILISGGVIAAAVLVVTMGQGMFGNLNRIDLDTLLGKHVVETPQNAPVATAILGFHGAGNTARFTTNAGDLLISTDGNNLTFHDGNGVELSASKVEDIFYINDPRFGSIPIEQLENQFRLTLGWRLVFVYKDNELWFLHSTGQLVQTLENAPTVPLLERYGHMGSSRGSIWSRTLPLITDTLLLGHGADTFPMYYPQWEYSHKIKYHGTPFIMVDKPHNQYLQIAVNQGLVALLAFLTAIAMYYYQTIRLAIKDRKSPLTPYRIAFSGSVAAYLFTALFNDGIVSVAPIFWILWGLGCAVNLLPATALERDSKAG